MATRAAGAVVGLIFGFTIVWSGMTSPNVIRGALLFEQSYLFLFFASAVATAAIGLAIVRRANIRAVLTGTPVKWARESVERRHIWGAFLFGIGWGVANVCPGPVATQVGQGIAWSLVTLAGVVIGVGLFLRQGRAETEPAAERHAAASAAPQTPARQTEPVTAATSS
jgi:uncharacterized protein